MKNQQGIYGARRLHRAQLILVILFTMLALVLSGKQLAVSALLGGMTSIVPSAIFARMVFAIQGARKARQIVNRFYKGEAIKIAMSTVLFALVFRCIDIAPLGFFAVYIIMQMVLWFAPIMFDNKQNGQVT